mgnify:FL=1
MINTPKIYKMRIVFRGPENTVGTPFIFNAVRKMVLASGLPFEKAKVNPHWPRLAYGPAPAKGQIAEREYLDIYLTEPVAADIVRPALEKAAPAGIQLLSVQRVPYALPSVQNLASAARYRIEGDFASYAPAQPAETFFNAARIDVVERAENGLTFTQNAKPFVLEVHQPSARQLFLTLACVDGKWFRPQLLAAAWLGVEIPAQADAPLLEEFTFIREGLFWRDSAGALHLI